MGALAENESMLIRISKYLRRLVAEQEADSALLSKEEFFSSLEKGEEEYRQGKTHTINSLEELKTFLDSL